MIWIPAWLYDDCIAEAERFCGLETGGVLMGYWYESSAAVITASGLPLSVALMLIVNDFGSSYPL